MFLLLAINVFIISKEIVFKNDMHELFLNECKPYFTFKINLKYNIEHK